MPQTRTPSTSLCSSVAGPLKFLTDRAIFVFYPPGGKRQVSMHMHYEDMREVFCPRPVRAMNGGTVISTTTPTDSTAMFGQAGLPWFEFRVERRLRELKGEYDPTNHKHTIKLQLATKGAPGRIWDQIITPGYISSLQLHPACTKRLRLGEERGSLAKSAEHEASCTVHGTSPRRHAHHSRVPSVSPIKRAPDALQAARNDAEHRKESTNSALNEPKASRRHLRLPSYRSASAARTARAAHGYTRRSRQPKTMGAFLKQLSS